MTKLLGGSKGLIQNKLKALILDLIHNIDVVNQLLNKEVKTLDDWQWFKQLKYQ
jgi:dynein heavy chain 2